MSISGKVKGLMALYGKRQLDLAAYFGMSRQTLSNKMARESWSGRDLIRAAQFVGCRVAFVLPDGQLILLDPEPSGDQQAGEQP